MFDTELYKKDIMTKKETDFSVFPTEIRLRLEAANVLDISGYWADSFKREDGVDLLKILPPQWENHDHGVVVDEDNLVLLKNLRAKLHEVGGNRAVDYYLPLLFCSISRKQPLSEKDVASIAEEEYFSKPKRQRILNLFPTPQA